MSEYVWNVIRIVPPTQYTMDTAVKAFMEAVKGGDESAYRVALGELRRTLDKAIKVEVSPFSNEDAAVTYDQLISNWYPNDPIYTERAEVLDEFVQYKCEDCGSTKFILEWDEARHTRAEYDPSEDSFEVDEPTNDDYRNIEIRCARCNSRSIADPGDLEERIFN